MKFGTNGHDLAQAAQRIDAHAMVLVLIEARLKEAARVLRLMPVTDARFLARMRAHWPDYALESFDKWIGYKKDGRTPLPRLSATAAQISRMDECMFVWLPWLLPEHLRETSVPPDVPHIVWARSNSLDWKSIGDFRKARGQNHSGNSRVSLLKIYRRGIASIADRLDRENLQLTIPDDWGLR